MKKTVIILSALTLLGCKKTPSTAVEEVTGEVVAAAEAAAEASQTTFLFEAKRKAFFYDDNRKVKKAYLVKGDKGEISKMGGNYGLATYTNAQGVKTTGWLNLCDLTFHFVHDESLQFSTVEKKDTFFFDDAHRHFIAYDLSFTYPTYFKGGDLAKLQQQFVESAFGDKYKKVKPENILEAYWSTTSSEYDTEDMKEVIADYAASEATYAITYEIGNGNDILRLENNLLQYEDYYSSYTGGAHGSAGTNYRIIDLRTGKPVLYKDIFNENATDEVTKLIVAEYLKQREWQALDEYYPEKSFESWDNIRIEDTGLTFHYGYYAVSAYYEGEWDVFVPYSQLLPYMKKDSPLYEIAARRQY